MNILRYQPKLLCMISLKTIRLNKLASGVKKKPQRDKLFKENQLPHGAILSGRESKKFER